MRHGLADRSAWDGSDFERPLTPAGQERMAREAEAIAQLGLGLNLILTSPLVRARQTAEIVADRLEMRDRLQEVERLGLGFGPTALRRILADLPDVDRLLLVGHEPSFSQTIAAITGGTHVVCKKGSLARVDILQDKPLLGELAWLIPPKELAR